MSEYQSETKQTQTRTRKGVEPQGAEEGKNTKGFVGSDSASDLGAEGAAKPTPKSSRHRHRHHEHAGKEKKPKKDSTSAADQPKAHEEGGGDDGAEDSDLDLDADSTGDVSLLEVFQNSDPKQLERLFSCLCHTHNTHCGQMRCRVTQTQMCL